MIVISFALVKFYAFAILYVLIVMQIKLVVVVVWKVGAYVVHEHESKWQLHRARGEIYRGKTRTHIYIYIICRPGGPYWEKLCQRSWVRPEAAGRGPCSRPRAQFFSIRTDQGRQIIFLFFSCCFSKVKRVLLFSESNVLQARVKWTMKRSRLWRQSSKIRFFTLLKLRNHRKQYN